MAELEQTMFREYDVRGRVNEKELNARSVEIIGKGFASFLLKRGLKECIVGFDSRSYSEGLKNALGKGLTSSGINVIEIGMVLVPVLYFSQYHLKNKAAAMVTASHNPNGWSGFKFAYGYSLTLLPDDIKELAEIIKKDDFVRGEGKARKESVLNAYKQDLVKRVNLKKKMRVVVDAGNGTAGPIAPGILRSAGIGVIELFCELDSSFPNHEPNPSAVESLKALGKKVVEEHADLGVAFDGDGDRLGVVDEKGNIVLPDRILLLLARQVLKESPGEKIVFDVKSSQALEEDIKAHGGIPIMWKTGHSYIKQKCREENAALGGELSGHMFFLKGYYGFDDAVFASMKLTEFLSSQEKTLSELLLTAPQYLSSPTIHAECSDSEKYAVVEKLTKEFKKDGFKVIDINGARVLFKDGWGLVRASSNLPVLVLRFEAKSKEALEEIKGVFREKMAKYKEIGKEWKSG